MDQQTVTQLVERIEREHAAFTASLAQLSDAQMTEPGAQDDWSVKDILAHISFWHRRMSHLVDSMARGEPFTSLRNEGEDGDAAVDRVNAENYAANHGRPLADVRAEYDQAYQQALASVSRLADDDLAADSQISTALGAPVLDLIAGDTYEHYQEHLAPIQAWATRSSEL